MHHHGPIPDVVCKHCQQPLNAWTATDGGEVTFRHPRLEGYDHDPVPVPRGDVATVRYVCDFCSEDGAQWSYPVGLIRTVTAFATYTEETERKQIAKNWEHVRAKPGAAQDFATHLFSDRWAACDPCSALIELRDMERLITRLRRLDPTKAEVPRSIFRDFYAEFFRLVREREPISPTPNV